MARRNTIGRYSKAKLTYLLEQNKAAGAGDITAVAAGNGLSGGGTEGDVTLAVDIDGATDGTGISVATDDMILLADASDGNAVKKINISQLPSSGGDITGVTAGNGLTGGGTTGDVSLEVDISSANDGTGISVNVNDYILLADASDSDIVKKINISQLPFTSPTSPAGSNTQIQFNDGGSFGASSNLTFDGSALAITGDLSVSSKITSAAISGSIQALTDGTPYLIGQGSVTITSASNGSVYISGSSSGASVAGSNTQIQYNVSGSLGATQSLTYDGSVFGVVGNITSSAKIISPVFSGSLQCLTDGTPYLIGQGSVTITSASNGSVYISGSATGASAAGSDTQIQYNTGGSLDASSGLTFDGSTFGVTGNITSSAKVISPAFSGSLQALTDGTPYLIGQGTVTITSASNGSVYISGSTAAGGGSTIYISGTPADNQLTVWTNPNTVEGVSGLTWDGSTYEVHGHTQLDSITTSGSADLNGDMSVVGDVTIDGKLIVSNLVYAPAYVHSSSNNPSIEISSSNAFTGYINEKLLLLSHADANDTDDKGIIFKRGGVNKAIIWDESEDKISFVSTNANETTSGSVPILGYAPIISSIGHFTSALSATGSVEITGTLGVNVSGAAVTHGITLPNVTSDTSGMMKATAYLTYSSLKYKENISPIQNSLDKLENLRAVEFSWKDSGKKDIGFIVEEVEKELPEVIGYDNGQASSMDYAKMTSFLLQCMKEQQEQIKDQRKEINFLKNFLIKKDL